MDDTDRALNALKAQMTEEQRKDMADLLQAELARREKEKMSKVMPKHKSSVKASTINGGGLDAAGVGELYDDVEKNIRELRLRKLERELAAAKSQQQRLGKFAGAKASLSRAQGKLRSEMPAGAASVTITGAPRMPVSIKNLLLLCGILAFAGFKIVFTTGVVDASVRPAAKQPAETKLLLPRLDIASVKEPSVKDSGQPEPEARASGLPIPAKSSDWTDTDKQMLGELDARRVELEQRKGMIERREAEVEKQTRILAERMAELNGLTAKLAEVRKDKENRYEARLEQLANVYGSMAPNEAAPLIAKLDNEIALGLIQRMPEKRMGQILGMMQAERAIELTRYLTDRGKF